MIGDAKKLKRILMMAGGTGGHVFPGLAVASHLRNQGIEVHWLGTVQGIEARLVKEAGFPLHFITISGLRGKGLKTLLTSPFKITSAILQARKVIKKIEPDLVIGMGGFASGPGGLASWLLKCPLIIHEQNAKAGFTNKILGRFSQRILEGFPSTFKPEPKVITIGNPIREEICLLKPPAIRFNPPRSPYRLLILGGSLGAQALNEIVPKALAKLDLEDRPHILHQTGEKNFEATKKGYGEFLSANVNLVPFINDMAKAYDWADVVLCRAGALTVAELCTAGLGAILVPYPYATDDHQTSNAKFMVGGDAALCISQTELTDTRLADILKQFAHFPEKRLAMAQAAYQLRKENVTEKIFQICKEVCL